MRVVSGAQCLAALVVLLNLAPALAQDADGDGILDTEDNCVEVFNPGQVDEDGGGLGSVCDCSPTEALNEQELQPARELSFLSKTLMEWTPAGPGTLAFDVVRSPTPNDFGGATCVSTDTAALIQAVDDDPVPAAFFYLVRQQSFDEACGGGNLGADSAEQRRTAVACPAGAPLPTCTITFEAGCPNAAPQCGASFQSGDGCIFAGLGNCYSTGIRSFRIQPATPLGIVLDDDLLELSVFFSHQAVGTTGTMRFFDADNLEVDSPLTTNGPCAGPTMPATQTVSFSRPVRRIEVTASGGTVWLDTFLVN